MGPFQQIPFDRLPQHPRLAHPWDRAERHQEVIHTDSFGALDTCWHTYGEGRPLVLIHGLMTHAWSFRYLLEPLGSHYRLIMPDLPGTGASGKPDRDYHPDRLAEWIGAFMAHVGVRGAAAVGNSLGGYLCLRLALRDRGALGCLVDLHSPGIWLPRLGLLHVAMRLPGALSILRWLVRRDPERWCHRNVHYHDESLKSLEEARIWAAPLRQPGGIEAFGCYLRDTMDASELRRFTGQLRGLRERGEPFPIPLQLVYATTDPMVPPVVGQRLGELIPSAQLRWLQGASHFAHVDAVEAFVAAVQPFLAEHADP